MNTNQLANSVIVFCLFACIGLFLVACTSDDSGDPIMDDEVPEEETALEGIFVDSPVGGLSYSSSSTSGVTMGDGTFEYFEGETVTFSIGGITIGSAVGAEELSPIDLVDISNADLSTPEVRNIASLLQSLDEDANPENGITISEATRNSLASTSLDFSSGEFYLTLQDLIEEVNTSNSSSLATVNQNAAGLHLAQSLGRESEFTYLPRVVEGRAWENGVFYSYNTADSEDPNREYAFDVRGDKVRYHFGENFGYYMTITYSQNELRGDGNLYSDLDQDPPIDPSNTYEYRNRVSSPGFVFNYGGRTYMGYYNFYKSEGTVGQLQGTYHSYLDFDQKQILGEPEYVVISNNRATISGPNSANEYDILYETLDENDMVTSSENHVFTMDNLNNEEIILVRFQDTDHIFLTRDLSNNTFFPGLLTSDVK